MSCSAELSLKKSFITSGPGHSHVLFCVLFFRYVESIQVRCRSQIHLGNELDGGYHVCEDTEVAPIKPCLVYSFG